MKRDQHVRVRLMPAHQGHATQVKLTKPEKLALQKASTDRGFNPKRGLSTFIREVGVQAASDYWDKVSAAKTPGALFKQRVIELAAEEAGMNSGEWMRVVALAVINFSALQKQITNAKSAYLKGLPKPDDGEDEE